MYRYRQATPQERQEMLAYRRLMGFPLHQPPHIERDNSNYLLTAATFEHRILLNTAKRLHDFEHAILARFSKLDGACLYGWVVQPTHYHLLAHVDLPTFRDWDARLHHDSAKAWNLEDNARGRQVWYRFSDRGIRTEAHFWAALNYIHQNPVRHGMVESPADWRFSSFRLYLEELGERTMEELLQAYPTLGMGKGWDR